MTKIKKTLLALLLFFGACALSLVGAFFPARETKRVSANADEGYALPISVVGGSIRLPADEEDVMGVRFLCEVQWYEEFGENFSEFDGMGVLLNLKTDGELSMDNHRAKVEYLTDGVLSTENKLNRGYVVDGEFVADSTSDNYYMIVYCYGIPAAQYHAEFACVGYVEAEEMIFYSESVTRSVAEVAFKAYQTTDDEGVKATLSDILTDEGYEHDMSVYVSDEKKHWLSCSLCGYYDENAATLGEAHTPDSSGICSVCGYGFESAVLLEGVESFTYTHTTTLNHALTMTDGKTLEYSTDQTGATYATETKGKETYKSIKDKYVENVMFTDEYGNPAPPEQSSIPTALVDEVLWYYVIENGVEYELSYYEESGVWVQGRLESDASFEASKEAGLSIFRNAVHKFNQFTYDEQSGTYKNAEPMSLELRETTSEGWTVIDRTEDMYFEFKIVNGTIEWMELKATFIDETDYTMGYAPLWTYLGGNLYGQKARETITGTVSVRYFNINSTTLELPENIVLDETVTSYHCQHEHLAEWEKQEYFHLGKCNDCNRFVNYAMHDFKEGVCVDCGYVCLHSEYSGRMNLGYNHAVFCDNCGNTVVEDHTFEEGYCTVCRQRVCEHENISDLQQFGSSYHGYYCNDCDSMLRQPHTFENEICTVCSYEICHHEGEKTYRIMQDQHGFSCPDCGEGVYEDHTFVGDICSVCGFDRECTHPETKFVAMSESEHCIACATCGLTMDGPAGQHTFTAGACTECGYACKHSGVGGWNSIGDGGHEARCYTCEQTVREPHDFQNGQCQKCGVIDCDHVNADPIQRQNNEYHGFYCEDCGQTVREPHAYVDDYCAVCKWTRCYHVNLADGEYTYDRYAHWIWCPDCNSELRDEHEMDGDTCAVCGYEVCHHENVTSFVIYGERHSFTCPDCDEWIGGEHDFDGTVCTVCGYNTACEHVEYILTVIDEYMHANVCKVCRLVNEDEGTVHHAFEEGVCTECEYSCPHSNVDWNWTSETEHVGHCSNCNKDFSGDHVAPEGGWEYWDQGHWQVCVLCDNSMTQEPHEFESGVCKVCSYECTHSYDVGPACRVCGEKCTHEGAEWTNGSEAHHQRYCSRCNVTESEEHSNASKEWTVRLSDVHAMECEVCGGLFGHTGHSPDDETGICVECEVDTTCKHASGNVRYQGSFYPWSLEYRHAKYYGCCGVYVEEDHNFDNGVCIHCDFECTHWKECTPSVAGTHTVRCTNCQLTWTENCVNTEAKAFLDYHEVRCYDCQGVVSSEAHDLTDEGNCTVCSYSSNCAHDSVYYQNVSNTQHEVICNNCDVIKERVEHTYQYETCKFCLYRCDHNGYEVTCTPNGDTHTYHCAHCGMDWEGEHYDNDDEFDQWDETNHYDLCDECGAKINESAHNLNTEWGFCYDCNIK